MKKNGFTLVEFVCAVAGVCVGIIFLTVIAVLVRSDALSPKRVVVQESAPVLVGSQKVEVELGVQTVGNMTFIRPFPGYVHTVSSDGMLREMMVKVDLFERAHPEIEVTSRQLVGGGYIYGVMLNHRPRSTSITAEAAH